ncbi:hypothetical protein LTR28_001074 [Elasticomyces elasticus]|nr:hypothetical protein LTR28_001074 [Elasticomyces elasticus]
MFGGASTATPTFSTQTASPTRTGRLRGLSYLRTYTHGHLHSHSPPIPTASPPRGSPSLTRSTTAPTPTPHPSTPPPASFRTPEPAREQQRTAPSPRRSTGDLASDAARQNPTSGWVPTVRGQSGLDRVASQPESTTADSSADTSKASDTTAAMTRTRAAMTPRTTSQRAPAAATVQRASAAADTLDDPLSEEANVMVDPSQSLATSQGNMPNIQFLPHQERSAVRPSLHFETISRTLPTASSIIRVGRYSERDSSNFSSEANNSVPSAAPVGFKSKVVSRRHCEFWCANGQWYIRDVKSSSGTFLNHVRLSQPASESRPFPVNDGDIVQLGIDFKEGKEMIFRCVKIRIECNRGWQKGLNNFNTSTHNRLIAKRAAAKDSDAASMHSSECSICLNQVAPCQALFVASCSHVWHFKCIRPMIFSPSWPHFLCPNCRAMSDLEADVEEPAEAEDWEDADALAQEPDLNGQPDSHSEDQAEDGAPSQSDRPAANNNYVTDDELAEMSENLSINRPTVSAPEPGFSASATSRPVSIAPTPKPPAAAPSRTDPVDARSTTPTSTAQFALAAGILGNHDGPLTPRNDAGPFILDGSAGRREMGSLARATVEERE